MGSAIGTCKHCTVLHDSYAPLVWAPYVQQPSLYHSVTSHRRAVLAAAVKIGRPGYRVTKQFDQDTQQRSLLFQVCGGFCADMHG